MEVVRTLGYRNGHILWSAPKTKNQFGGEHLEDHENGIPIPRKRKGRVLYSSMG